MRELRESREKQMKEEEEMRKKEQEIKYIKNRRFMNEKRI